MCVTTLEELTTVLRIATELGMPIATRGSGHSQSGQCLSDAALVLDMRALNSVELDAEHGSAWLGSGASWQQVCNASFGQGRLPVGLTMIVDTTVAGTLSVAGVGSESFRTGTQVDQVLELDVATLDGALGKRGKRGKRGKQGSVVRCSAEHNRELFDAVRGGLGQCGVIVKARYPLRRARARMRTYTLAYAQGRELVDDMQLIASEARCDFMFGCLLWAEQSGWQLLLFLGNQFDDESELTESTLLSGLHFERELPRADHVQWQSDGNPGHPFFRRFEKQSAEILHHPWADHVCEPRVAAELLTGVLSDPAIAARPGVCGAVLGVAARTGRAPLVRPATSGSLFVVGVFPEASDAQLEDAVARMRQHNERGAALGATRYLSGFLDGWTARDWSAHFGEVWPWFRSMKARFDPRGLLNNGCVRWQ